MAGALEENRKSMNKGPTLSQSPTPESLSLPQCGWDYDYKGWASGLGK